MERKKLAANVRIETLGRAAPPCEICGEPTTFARYTDVQGKRVGRFAHIRAVNAGGPRHDPAFAATKVDSPENLFWCCTDCHEIVDVTELWDLRRLESTLRENRAKRQTSLQVTIDGEITVVGYRSRTVTGIDAGGKPTVLSPGTKVRVEGYDSDTVTGIRT